MPGVAGGFHLAFRVVIETGSDTDGDVVADADDLCAATTSSAGPGALN